MSQVPTQPPPPPPPRGSLLPISLALLVGTLICVALALLTFNAFGLVLLAAAGVFLLAGLHYLVWGWWLGRILRQREEEEDAKLRK